MHFSIPMENESNKYIGIGWFSPNYSENIFKLSENCVLMFNDFYKVFHVTEYHWEDIDFIFNSFVNIFS